MQENKNAATEIFGIEVQKTIDDMVNMHLPSPELVNYYRFNKERKIWLVGEIDDSVMGIEQDILLWNMEDGGIPVEERDPIYIYIMSPGGYGTYMWSLIDVILASKTPVYTVNMGQCASAAALIFMSGHQRFMMERATVMIHEGATEFSGDSTKVIDASESYKVFLKRMHQFVVAKTGISAATLNRKKNNDWELDSKYCLENGVCDHVVTELSEII